MWAWYRPPAGLADVGPQPGVPDALPATQLPASPRSFSSASTSPPISSSSPLTSPALYSVSHLDRHCHLSLQAVIFRTRRMLALRASRRKAEFRPTPLGVLNFTQAGLKWACACSEDLGCSAGNGASVHERGSLGGPWGCLLQKGSPSANCLWPLSSGRKAGSRSGL